MQYKIEPIDGVTVEFDVTGYWPEERATFDYPGSAEEWEFQYAVIINPSPAKTGNAIADLADRLGFIADELGSLTESRLHELMIAHVNEMIA